MKLTEAEWQIMNALWQKHPATAREIMDRLDRPGQLGLHDNKDHVDPTGRERRRQ